MLDRQYLFIMIKVATSIPNQLGVDCFGPSKKREHLLLVLGSFEAGLFFIISELRIHPIEKEAHIFREGRIPLTKLKIDGARVCETDGFAGMLRAS